jgi:GxxExxY protein
MNEDSGTKSAGVMFEPSSYIDAVASSVLDAAIEVHRVLGQGFLESVYHEALCIELDLRRIPFVSQPALRVPYKGHTVGEARPDLFVAERLIVELKTVDSIAPIHLAQALSYLKATRLPLALLINFNVPVLLRGVRRVIRSKTNPSGDPSAPGGSLYSDPGG